MRADFVTGRTAKGAAVRGLLLGLVLQALLLAAASLSRPPIDRELATLAAPSDGGHTSPLLAQAHR